MRFAQSQRLHAAPLALLLLALALAPTLLLAHEAGEHADHGSCELSELAIDINAAGSFEQGAKPAAPNGQSALQQLPLRQALQQQCSKAFSARAPPRVTGQIASVHPA